jgi:uncharacterized protein YjbJ (UPF0337 family)
MILHISTLLFHPKTEPPEASFVLSRDKHNEGRVPGMDREHVKGTAEKAKGAIKDTAGKITDDKKLETEGKFDKAKGSAHNVAGDIKDAVKQSNK